MLIYILKILETAFYRFLSEFLERKIYIYYKKETKCIFVVCDYNKISKTYPYVFFIAA